MAHKTQKEFFAHALAKYFANHEQPPRILDVGSLDINGNNREACQQAASLFGRSFEYTGLDLFKGPNVDVVGRLKDVYGSLGYFDLIVSSSAFEHDKDALQSLCLAASLLKEGGEMVISIAGFKYKEHGTTRSSPKDSPGTNDHYKNITGSCIARWLALRSDMQLLDYNEVNKPDMFFTAKRSKGVVHTNHKHNLDLLISNAIGLFGYVDISSVQRVDSELINMSHPLLYENETARSIVYIDTKGDYVHYRNRNGNPFIFSHYATTKYYVWSNKLSEEVIKDIEAYSYAPIIPSRSYNYAIVDSKEALDVCTKNYTITDRVIEIY